MKKISVISGGTSGLGLEIADLLVRAGKNVLVLGRSTEKLAKASEKLKKSADNNRVESLSCNIGDEKDILKVAEFLTKDGYSVEYLFNNAGRGLFQKADVATSELIDKVFESSLKGMILLTSKILHLTPSSEELTIINIMSTSALYGRDEETIYCAAKWGARGYTEALRTELKGTKRNIIAVYPGGMRTDFWKVPGQSRDVSAFMDPAEVAKQVVDAVLVSGKLLVTDITINRKK
ncbi:MAG TPA: SDR family NAD(P)-dependent oxidoreductase [Bacteroidales bacterium]|nr:SDR family NAD(P)-dependent oxidoreductase [Bacteroidales bacterium]HPT21024.1 SDR family NAD(P)-dependent oxidoreductase [Bacteroidales bacterium]